jgi:hypothetical protein
MREMAGCGSAAGGLRCPLRRGLLAPFLLVLFLSGPASAAPVHNTDNGHYYEAVARPQGITWDAARAEAEGRSYNGLHGHLATLTSASAKIEGIAWSPDGRSFAPAYPQARQIQPGETRFLEITGEGLASIDTAGIAVSGGIQADPTKLQRGAAGAGTPWLIVPITARADAAPGPRSLSLAQGEERALMTGSIEVVAG